MQKGLIMTYTLTDDDVQAQYAKLKKIDEFAKSLGFTIYRIDCDFIVHNEVQTLIDTTLNRPSDKYLDFLAEREKNTTQTNKQA